MKKMSLSVLALAAVGMLATPAEAYNGRGFYLGARAGYAATSLGKAFGRSDLGGDVGTFSIAAGVQNGGLRGEIEALTRTRMKNNGRQLNSYNLTFNLLYELDMGGRLKPFIGASAGLSRNEFKHPGMKKQKHNDFVYGPMAGLTYDITNSLSADFTYKYLIVDNYKTGIGKKDIVSNEYVLGLRYKF
jgi:opacity protein-like surface antigen